MILGCLCTYHARRLVRDGGGVALRLALRDFASAPNPTVFNAALPRGMTGLMRHESAHVVEWLAESYTNLSIEEMNAFHRLCTAKMLPPGASFEAAVLQVVGGGGGAGGGRSAAAAGAVPSAAPQSPVDAISDAVAPAAKKTIEKTTFDVKLGSYPAENKVKLIKELRAVVSLSIQEAKGAIDKSPGLVATSLGKDDAEKLKGLLKKHGAAVELL